MTNGVPRKQGIHQRLDDNTNRLGGFVEQKINEAKAEFREGLAKVEAAITWPERWIDRQLVKVAKRRASWAWVLGLFVAGVFVGAIIQAMVW